MELALSRDPPRSGLGLDYLSEAAEQRLLDEQDDDGYEHFSGI